MNFVYDILLNFHEDDFEFYDWNFKDSILHIRKIPLIKVNTKQLYNIINYNFKIDNELLKKISNRTEIFANRGVKIIKYACLFCDGKDVIAVKFKSNGKKDTVSRMLIDEKEEVLENYKDSIYFEFNINIDNKINFDKFKTRKEKEIYKYIIKQFNKNNYDKLKYTYFECFNNEEVEYSKIINKLKEALKDNWNLYYNKIYDILKLSSTNNI